MRQKLKRASPEVRRTLKIERKRKRPTSSTFTSTPRRAVFDHLDGKRDGCLQVEPIRRRPVPPFPLPPHRPAVRRRVPTHPWYVRIFPGHALQENWFQRPLGVGTLVSDQERRAPVVPRTNGGQTAGRPLVDRWSTAGQPRILFPQRFT